MPTIGYDRQSASSLLKTTFMLSASPICHLHFLQAKFIENIGAILSNSQLSSCRTNLGCLHFYANHLFQFQPTIVVVSKGLLSNLCSQKPLHFLSSFLSSVISVIKAKPSSYTISLSIPSFQLSDNMYHIGKRIGDNKDSWCIPILTTYSSDNSCDAIVHCL